jgi:hypothetical protein
MTEACFLARGARPLWKPTTCEECLFWVNCKMFENFKALQALKEKIEGVQV